MRSATSCVAWPKSKSRPARRRSTRPATTLRTWATWPTELGLFTLPFPLTSGGADSMLSSCAAVEEFGRALQQHGVATRRPMDAVRRYSCGRHKRTERALPAGPRQWGLARSILVDRTAKRLRCRCGSRPGRLALTAATNPTVARFGATTSAVSDFIVVAAKTGESDERGAVNFFIVEKDMDGFGVGRKEDKARSAGCAVLPPFSSGTCSFRKKTAWAPEGEGFKIVMEALNESRRRSPPPAASGWRKGRSITRRPLSRNAMPSGRR